ncbi:MAG: MFS transporter [Candidatus Njordarchaeales archaeon]
MHQEKVDYRKYLINRILLPIISFTVTLGFGMAQIVMIYLLLSFEGILTTLPEELGTIPEAHLVAIHYSLMMSAFMLTRAFLARYFGNLSDLVGRKKLIIVGLFGYSLVSYGYVLSSNWIHLLIMRSLQGIASAMVWPVAEALIVDSAPWKERGRWMSIYMMATNASFALGPALGVYVYKFGVIYYHLGVPDAFKFPFYALFYLSLVSFLMSFMLRETIRIEGEKSQNRMKYKALRETLERSLPPEISRAILVIYIMGFANGVSMGFVSPLFTLYVNEYVTSDPVVLGWLSTISALAGILVSYPAGYISDITGRKNIIILGQLGTRTMTLVLPFIRTVPGLLGVYVIRTVSFNIMSPVYRALQGDLVPRELRGKVFGTVQTLFNLGAAASPFGGWIYLYTSDLTFNILGYILPGVAVVFILSALIGYFSTALFILFVPEPRKREE